MISYEVRCWIAEEKRRQHDNSYKYAWAQRNSGKVREQKRKCQDAHRDEYARASRERYYADHESNMARRREYYREHRDEILEHNREKYRADPEGGRRKARAYYQEHKGCLVAAQAKRRAENPEHYRELWVRRARIPESRARKSRYDRVRYANDEELRLRKLLLARAWRHANRAKRAAMANLRDGHRRLTDDGTVTPESFEILLQLQNYRCAITGLDLRECGWHADHIVPLARGGAHSVLNIQLLAPRVNTRKKHRLESELPPDYFDDLKGAE